MDHFLIERLIQVLFVNFQVHNQTHNHRPSTPVS